VIPAKDIAPMTLRLPTNKIAQFMSMEQAIYAASAPAARPVMPVVSREDDDLMADANSGTFEYTVKKIKKSHIVRRGETLSQVAAKYDMSPAQLKKLNRLRSSKLMKGQRLTVYTYKKTKTPVKQQDVAKNDSSKTTKMDTSLTASADDNQNLTVDTAENNPATATKTTLPKNSNKFLFHVVQPGDTLWNIARRYEGVTVEEIKDMNNLRNSAIKVGTKLKLKLVNNQG